MILIDSSVFIDFLQGVEGETVDRCAWAIDKRQALLADLVLAEVLQGIDDDLSFKRTRSRLSALALVRIGDERVAVQAARNYRHLRRLGITVRKTIDTMIATRCILDGYALLFTDRDFKPFVEHLGLTSEMDVVDPTRGLR